MRRGRNKTGIITAFAPPQDDPAKVPSHHVLMSTKLDHLPQTNGPTKGTKKEQWSDEQVKSGITKYNKNPLPHDYESDTDSEIENGEFTDTESEEEPSSDEESTIMVDDEGSPIASASPRRPAKDQSEINRTHRLSTALKKHYPLLEITQVTGTHAYTHDRITGKTARWTLSQQGSLSSIRVNASTIALERNQDCQPVAAGTRSSDLPSPLPPSPEKALVPRSWSLPRSNPPRPLFTSSPAPDQLTADPNETTLQ